MRETIALGACGLLVVAALALMQAGCGREGRSASGRVTRVVDGDTIVVAGLGTVRYIGIDTPELHHPRRPVQRLARAARRRNAELVEGRVVRVVTGREPRDAHGRRLAYVFVDGQFVNARLVAEGLARTLAIRPNTEHAEELSALQQRARRDGLGLWGDAEGGPPWGRP